MLSVAKKTTFRLGIWHTLLFAFFDIASTSLYFPDFLINLFHCFLAQYGCVATQNILKAFFPMLKMRTLQRSLKQMQIHPLRLHLEVFFAQTKIDKEQFALRR